MTLDKFEKKIKNLIETKNNELEEIKTQKENNEEKIKNAKISLVQAKKDNNYDAFNRAKKDLWEANNMQEYLNGRIDILEGNLMTSKEYQENLDTLNKLLEKEISKLLEKTETLFNQVSNILNEEFEIFVKASKIGDLMQQEIANNSVIYKGIPTSFTPDVKRKIFIELEKIILKNRK